MEKNEEFFLRMLAIALIEIRALDDSKLKYAKAIAHLFHNVPNQIIYGFPYGGPEGEFETILSRAEYFHMEDWIRGCERMVYAAMERKTALDMDWVEVKGLAASGSPIGIRHLQSLYDQGIRAIVTLTEQPLTVQLEITAQLLREMDFVYLHAPVVNRQPPDLQTVEKVTQFIDRMKAEGRPVLVHCCIGSGRTGTMLHAYYLSKGQTLEDIEAMVKERRSLCQFVLLSKEQQAFLMELAGKGPV